MDEKLKIKQKSHYFRNLISLFFEETSDLSMIDLFSLQNIVTSMEFIQSTTSILELNNAIRMIFSQVVTINSDYELLSGDIVDTFKKTTSNMSRVDLFSLEGTVSGMTRSMPSVGIFILSYWIHIIFLLISKMVDEFKMFMADNRLLDEKLSQ